MTTTPELVAAIDLCPGGWRALAACAGMSGPDRDPWADRGLEAEAKAVCAGCPVVAECLADATDDRHTVRGGLSAEERAALTEDPDALPGMPVVVDVVAEHDRAQYAAGCRCVLCEKANTAYIAAWRARVTPPEALTSEQLDLFGRTA